MGSREEDRERGSDNQFQDATKNLKKIFDSTNKKVAQIAWRLLSSIPGGQITIGFIVVWILIAICFFMIIFGLIPTIPGGSVPKIPNSSGAVETIPGLVLTLTGPAPVDNGANMEFSISVSYSASSPPLSSIVVFAVIPPVAEFVGATGAFEYENGEIRWPMSQNTNVLKFTMKATALDTEYKDYRVYATTIAGSNPATGGSTAPTSDSCGGKYNIAATPIGANFGDPLCDFGGTKLYDLLEEQDPPNKDFWYECALLESSRNPNAYNGASTDSGGAYGLFQMGRGKNGPTDHGDVDWISQTSNAILHSKKTSSFKDYWQCARHLDYDGIK